MSHAEIGLIKQQPMPNTYTQIFLQFVFAVSRRQCLIPREHKAELHRFIGGLVKHRGCKPLAIHCMPDHAHIFVGYTPLKSIPDLVKEIKVESNAFINKKKWTPHRFYWQEGYGAFSYARKDIGNIITYINNQELHHKQTKFRTEYIDMLVENEIEYKDEFLFEFLD
jgi:putative transposase